MAERLEKQIASTGDTGTGDTGTGDTGWRTSTGLLSRLSDPNDAEAWNRFCQLYAGPIHSWALRSGLSKDDAEEACQEVLLTTAVKMRTFAYDPAGSYRAWLCTITRRVAYDIGKKARRYRTEGPVDDVADQAADDLEQVLNRNLQFQLLREAEARVRRRMAAGTRSASAERWKIAKRRWAIYVIRTRGKMETAAIADHYGISRHLVDVDKSRILAAVKKEVEFISKHGPEFE